MRNLNKKIEEPELQEEEVREEEQVRPQPQQEPERYSSKRYKTNKVVADVMGGEMFSREGFVKMFPFILYVVLLSMIYITNVYIAEDMNREVSRLKTKSENLHVEYVYLKSEITSITKQSNMVKMLKKQGIKESVDPLKKIVVEKEGGKND